MVNIVTAFPGLIKSRYQSLLDASTPFTKTRWISMSIILLIYLLRVFLLQGWYITTYALGIYYLNLLIAFLTPVTDPILEEEISGKICLFQLLSH